MYRFNESGNSYTKGGMSSDRKSNITNFGGHTWISLITPESKTHSLKKYQKPNLIQINIELMLKDFTTFHIRLPIFKKEKRFLDIKLIFGRFVILLLTETRKTLMKLLQLPDLFQS